MSGLPGADLMGLLGAEGLRIFAETERPADRPIVVLEARVAAVWRIAEGLVGGGVGLREEILEKGSRDFVGGIEDLMVGFEVFGSPDWERAAAADFEVRVEGPFDEIGFFVSESLDIGFVVEGLTEFCFRSGYNSSSTF